MVLGDNKWKRSSGNSGGTATITTQRKDSFVLVRNEIDSNGYGTILGQQKTGLDYYNMSRSDKTIVLTPTIALSGYIEYVEF